MKDTIKNIAAVANGCAVWIIEHKLFGWAVAILCAFAVCLSSGSAYAMYQHEGVYKERVTEWEDKYEAVGHTLDSLKVISKENNDMLKILILRK